MHIHRKLQAVEKMQKEHWPSSVHNVNYCQSLCIFLPFLSTPEAILHHRRKRGVPLCKWTVARKRSCRTFTGSLSRPSYINEQKKCVWEKTSQRASRYWVPPVVCAVFAKLDRRLAGRAGYWQGLTSVSPSLSLPLWTGARALLGLLYCAGGKLPIRGTLIEQWKQEFYKGADLLFITSHSLPLFLPHASIFHWLTMQHSNFLSWSFQQLPLYCVHSFLLCWNPPPSLETPMVRLGYNVAFSVSFSKTVWVKSLLVSLSIRQIV